MLEWNKRITQAMNYDNYFNDSATKPTKKIPSNPLDKLTLEKMKDVEGRFKTEGQRKYLRPSPSQEKFELDMQIAGSSNKKVDNNEAKALFVSFNNNTEPKQTDNINEKMIKEILRIEIILIMINTDLVSDFEVNRSKRYLKDFISKNPECLEAHYGLSQVYFSLGLYNRALEEINIALTVNKSDCQYLTWKALYLFYLFRTLTDRTKKIDALRKWEETCKKILAKERRNLFPLFLLLVLMVEVNKCKSQGLKISSTVSVKNIETKSKKNWDKKSKKLRLIKKFNINDFWHNY